MIRIRSIKPYFKILLFLVLIISGFLYFNAPVVYNRLFCFLCFVLYLFTFLLYFFIVEEKNYFNFITLFTVAFTFVNFVYPIFVFPFNKIRFYIYEFGFNENVINRATCLALIGYVLLILGYVQNIRKINSITQKNEKPTNAHILDVFCFMFLILNIYKIVVLRYSHYGINSYRAPVIWNYIRVLEHGAFVAALTEKYYYMYNKNQSFKNCLRLNRLFWFIFIINILVILGAGERTEPLCYGLIALTGYYLNKKKVRLGRVVIVATLGFLGMTAVGVMRGNDISSINLIDLSLDLIINNYTLYIAFDYVLSSGTVSLTLFGSLLRVIPFLSGYFVKNFNVSENNLTSARFLTELVIGNTKSLGIGTNLIGSLFLGAGFVGVFLGMFILGAVLAKVSKVPADNSRMSLMIFFEFVPIPKDFVLPITNSVRNLAEVKLFSETLKCFM